MEDKIYSGGELKNVDVTAPKVFAFDYEAGRKVLFPKGYSQKANDYVNGLVKESNRQGITIKAQLAYILATNFHEMYDYIHGVRFDAVIELGGENYLKSKPYYPHYGRGPNHLTWKKNYEMEGKRLGLDLVNNPDLMLDVERGCESGVYCMIHGAYTGKKLSDYITANKTDFQGARAIINGKDEAPKIAGYASEFVKCII